MLCEAWTLPRPKDNTMEKIVTRKGSTPIKVWCLPAEREVIRANAERSGMSVSRYLRSVGMGSEVKSVVDYERVSELTKMAGDLGRLGGLLKLWLTRPESLAKFGEARTRDAIEGALDEIYGSQKAIQDLVRQVLRT